MKATLYIFFLMVFCVELTAQIDYNIENKFRLAQSYEQTGQFDKAESSYRELMNQQKWNYQFFDALNRILIKQKKYNESIQLLEDQIKQTPKDINLYGMLGSTYYMLDNIPSAYDSWERGIKTDPASFVVYRVIVNYAIENRLFDKAIEILMRGKMFAEDPMIFSLDLANIYTANMRFEDAVKEYCSMLSKRPDQIGIVKSRIATFIDRATASDLTIKAINNCIDEYSQPALYDLLSYCYARIGDYENGFEAIMKYEELIKSNGNALFTFAQDAYRNRQYLPASKGYKYLIDNFPKSQFIPNAKIAYARTLEASVDQSVIDTINWKPINPVLRYERSQYNDVINAYDRIAREYPGNAIYAEALYRIAEITFKRLGDLKSADSLYSIINEKAGQSAYSSPSYLSRSIIAIKSDSIEKAKSFLESVVQNKRSERGDLSEAYYHLARINFWEGNFSTSLVNFKEVTKNLGTDFSNDAIELSSLISATKKDSLNLLSYAKSDLLLFQNKLKEAAIEFKTLADNPNLFVINEFANYKLSNIFISEDKFYEAIPILDSLVEKSKSSIFADKSTFLLANIYHYGIKNTKKAIGYYQKVLEKYPNSLYFDRARRSLNLLTTNNG
ncbi:MAG: tetratricopeptide repeat protein [Bacteroidota bacterium]